MTSFKYQIHIETSGDYCSVALSQNEGLVEENVAPEPKTHSSWLAPAISVLLEKYKIRPSDLSYVSINAGPGSYTGLRVGFSFVKGFTAAQKIPIISMTISELILDKFKHRVSNYNDIQIIQLSRKEEYRVTHFVKKGRAFKNSGQYTIADPIKVSNLEGLKCIYNDSLKSADLVCKELRASDLLFLASEMFEKGKIMKRSQLEPIYFKPPYITKSHRKLI